MVKLPTKHHTIEVILEEDGYTAYYKDFPNLSAGGETEEEALRELANAFALAKESVSANGKNDFSLDPVVSFVSR